MRDTQNLNIERSLMHARWVQHDISVDAAERLVRQHQIPEIVAKVLISRKIDTECIQNFLHPSLKNDFPDPFSMQDMENMALYIVNAIKSGKQFAIFGDFDVDGATSSAIFHRFFKALGFDVPIYIPDRLSEGYGPNLDALKSLKEKGADIILMLDCGTTAFDIVEQGRDLGLDILIFDHHETEENLPRANFVINPKRQDDVSGLDMLAACGVVYLACVAINNKLRAAGYYAEQGQSEPNLKALLDVLALGTVCDMVPLTGPNRLFVRMGFKLMASTTNTGLQALMDVSRIEGAVNPYHAGFVLGPRINAGSRVHKADLGAQLLSTDDAEKANEIAWILNDCNDKRKEIQLQMEADALRQIEAGGLEDNSVLVVDDKNWHPGLSGLVAGRLKEKYGKPACVITYAANLNGEIEGRGSGRSVPGVHIAQAFIDARQEGIISKGGGHAMAGGFTIEPDKLDAFRAFLTKHIESQLHGQTINIETPFDAVISAQGVTVDLVKQIEILLGPFGQEFQEPLFVLPNVRLHTVDIVGEKHIRFLLSDWEGGSRIKAMAFSAVGTDMGEALLQHNSKNAFHVMGALKINAWQGRESAEIHVKDCALVNDVGFAS